MAPPASDRVTRGTTVASPIIPTASDDPVMVKTWNGMATTVSWRPR